jgi:predicted HAD superfamily hydrolase
MFASDKQMTHATNPVRFVSSFDIFDTLICRLVDRPTDVFAIMEETLGEDFAAARIQAERDARRASLSEEIGIDDIYRRLRDTGMSAKSSSEARDLEYALERRLCVRREDMLRVLADRRDKGDRLIGISDMYLPGDFVRGVLKGLGIELDAVYVSSDLGATKHTGRLFGIVRDLEGIDESHWTHYGDNAHSDVAVPLSLGINAVHCPIRGSILHQSADNHDGTAASVVRAIERAAAYGDRSVGERDRVWFDIGSRHTGPIAAQLCLLARETADRTGASHIYFLARDGHVLKKVYETLFPDDPRKTVYMAASRRMINFPLRCHVEPDYGFLSASSVGLTVQELLGRIGVSVASDHDTVVTSEENAGEIMRGYRDAIVAAANRELSELDSYIDHVGMSSAENAVLVDVGWFCSIQKSLASHLAASGRGVKLHGVYVGTNVKTETGFDATGLFFTAKRPAAGAVLVNSALEVMELLFTSSEDSIVTVVTDGNGFDIVRHRTVGEQTRHVAADMIQKGAVAFAEYLKTSGLLYALASRAGRNATLDDFRSLIERPTAQVARCASAVEHCVGIGGSDRRPLVAKGITWRKPIGLIDGYRRSFWPAATRRLLGRQERFLLSPPVQSLVGVIKRMPSPLRRWIVTILSRPSTPI